MKHPWEKKRPLSAWLPGGLSGEKSGNVCRTIRPILDSDKCIMCNLCWIYCPEGCINRGEEMIISYSDCRGCGVCAVECPKNAILMEKENQNDA